MLSSTLKTSMRSTSTFTVSAFDTSSKVSGLGGGSCWGLHEDRQFNDISWMNQNDTYIKHEISEQNWTTTDDKKVLFHGGTCSGKGYQWQTISPKTKRSWNGLNRYLPTHTVSKSDAYPHIVVHAGHRCNHHMLCPCPTLPSFWASSTWAS